MADHHVDDHDECDVLTCGVKRELTGLAHGVGTLREDCDYFRQAYSRKLTDERRALEAADAATARANAAEKMRDDAHDGFLATEAELREMRKRVAAAESALAEAKRDAAQARAANLENSLALAEARGALREIVTHTDPAAMFAIASSALARAGEQENREPASGGQEVPAAKRDLAGVLQRARTALIEAASLLDDNCTDPDCVVAARLCSQSRMEIDALATPPPGEQGKGGGEGPEALARIKELLETLPAPTGHLLAQIYDIARLAPAQPAEHPASVPPCGDKCEACAEESKEGMKLGALHGTDPAYSGCPCLRANAEPLAPGLVRVVVPVPRPPPRGRLCAYCIPTVITAATSGGVFHPTTCPNHRPHPASGGEEKR